MIHFVNGDIWADTLRENSPEQGEVFVWREMLDFGPFHIEWDMVEQANKRADFFEERLGIPSEQTKMTFVYQEQRLKRMPPSCHLVLWFDTDRYDQMMLLYLLKRCRELGISTIDLVTIPTGVLSGDAGKSVIKHLFDQRIPLGEEHLIEATNAWKDYIAEDPRGIVERLKKESRFDHVNAAFSRHLEYFPSQTTGLNIVEEMVLSLIQAGVSSFESLFREVTIQRPEDGLSDVHFAAIVNELTTEQNPLICKETSTTEEVWKLTALGERVLAGEEDRIQVVGIDWWLGGVHLQNDIWRRDHVGNLVQIDSLKK
ncbi:protein of unknown function [Marininema mesophilum]|uniref:DUF1835 domain-containing protein n=1 Tax=Marininema mesophilum TaxID=1048340 RepID=A0A1H2WM74_9BACL|nr:DUF1835 domain-containing protein [Marininema mesophilum]SDW81598.1 protein of unknown function [Marininema mesophilum]